MTPYKLPLIDIIPTFPAITPATVAALRFEKLGEMMDGFIFSTVFFLPHFIFTTVFFSPPFFPTFFFPLDRRNFFFGIPKIPKLF